MRRANDTNDHYFFVKTMAMKLYAHQAHRRNQKIISC